MTKSELYKKGDAMRRSMYGEEDIIKQTRPFTATNYAKVSRRRNGDSFGALWTRPGLDTKTRALICVVSISQQRGGRVGNSFTFCAGPRVDRR